jgi:N-formylglutamate amidohydrolase
MIPYTVRRPAGTPRLLFDSPHSGRDYPGDFDAKASRIELRRGEDAYVDDLLAGSVAHGACLLAATPPRCYLDLNRAETDIDAELLAEPWPVPLAPTEKTRRGLGLIRRYVVPGVEIYGRRLSVREVQDRIAGIYRPYHAALDELVREIHDARGAVWHVNWHSMKSVGNAMTPDGEGARRPDVVVSDLDGRSAAPAFTRLIVETLVSMGYRVSVNDPYKGGTIVQRIGNPAGQVHSVQIEVNRALYLDEPSVEKTAGAAGLTADLTELARRLADAAPDIRRRTLA